MNETATVVLPPSPRAPAHRAHPGVRSASVIAMLLVAYAVSVVLIAQATAEARTSTGHGHFAVFWAGMAIAVVATVVAGTAKSVRLEALPVILTLFGVFTYVPKFLMSAYGPAYYDEYAHVRHVNDMLASGGVFVKNPLLSVVQYFPGLGLCTELVHWVTGLNPWHSGQIVILLAHCAALPLVYALARTLSISTRAAFVAALIFAANPGYLYFDSQYAYESLAITFMIATVLACTRAKMALTPGAADRSLIAGCVFGTLTVLTHHVTALFMALLCVLIVVLVPSASGRFTLPRWRRAQVLVAPWAIAAWAAAFAGVWILGVASQTRNYIFPRVVIGASQLRSLVFGTKRRVDSTRSARSNARTLFAGNAVPSYEHVIALVTPALVAVGVAYTLWRIWRHSAQPVRELRIAAPFAIFSIGYLLSLPLTFTGSGTEPAHRSWPFLYLGVSILLVWTFGRPGIRPARALALQRSGKIALAAALLIFMTVGNVSAGANIAYRFPGPYQFGVDNRFQNAELRTLVRWTSSHLPASAAVITDRFTEQQLLVGSRLRVPTVTQSGAYGVFTSPQAPSPTLRAFLRRNGFRYFILDIRTVDHVPVQPLYQSYHGLTPAQLTALGAIRDTGFIHQIHSTAHYRVYLLRP